MISFDQLPMDNPGSVKADLYYADIEKAEMKQGKDLSKPPYLNMTLKLFDRNGKSAGTMFDIISESDNNAIQYKIGRFVRACGIPLVGAMELKDLAKIVQGKRIVVDTKEDEYNGKKKLVVNLFEREAFYLPTEFEETYAIIHPNMEAQAEANKAFVTAMQEGFEKGGPEEVPFEESNSTAKETPAETTAEY